MSGMSTRVKTWGVCLPGRRYEGYICQGEDMRGMSTREKT